MQSNGVTPPQARECGQQYQGAESAVVIEVDPAFIGKLPQCALGRFAGAVDLWRGSHHVIATEPQPVAARRKLANVADRAAADPLGQIEDLGDGEHWALASV